MTKTRCAPRTRSSISAPGRACAAAKWWRAGTAEEIADEKRSLTGQYLAGTLKIEIPPTRRAPGKQWLKILGASHNNLKNVDIEIPALNVRLRDRRVGLRQKLAGQ